jgi:hypothetical protein
MISRSKQKCLLRIWTLDIRRRADARTGWPDWTAAGLKRGIAARHPVTAWRSNPGKAWDCAQTSLVLVWTHKVSSGKKVKRHFLSLKNFTLAAIAPPGWTNRPALALAW